MFNCHLDRRIVIDSDYGYFKEIIKKSNSFHPFGYYQKKIPKTQAIIFLI